jgi:hypothetical protein
LNLVSWGKYISLLLTRLVKISKLESIDLPPFPETEIKNGEVYVKLEF